MPRARSIDSYLTGFIPKKEPLYEINDLDECPRCGIGVIIKDYDDAVCLNCGLREINTLDLTARLEARIIQWCIRNLPRQLFSTEDFLNQELIGEDTQYIRLPAYRNIIDKRVESILLELVRLEQRGAIRIHKHGVTTDYDEIIVIYDILDKENVINKRLAPVGVL